MPDVHVVIPVLPVADLARAHKFYCDVLGFLEPWGFGEPPQYGGVRADLAEMPAIHFTVCTDRSPAISPSSSESLSAVSGGERPSGRSRATITASIPVARPL